MVTFDRNHNAVRGFGAYRLSAWLVACDSDFLVLHSDTRLDRCDFICYRLHRCVRLHGAVCAVDCVSSRRNQRERDLTHRDENNEGLLKVKQSVRKEVKLFLGTVLRLSKATQRGAVQGSL